MIKVPSRVAVLALLVMLSLTAAACSSGTSNGAPDLPVTVPTNTAQSPNQELKAAVQAYSNDYLGGNGAGAFALLSSRCQLTLGLQQVTALASAAKSVYGVVPITSITIDSDSGGKATVSYTYPVTTLNQSQQPWVLEGGSWKYDHC